VARGGSFKVQGATELTKKLQALPEAANKGARAATKAETEAVADDMRRGVPRDTGKLQESIQAEFDPKTISGKAVATAPHAQIVENGTVRQRAQPFAQPAAERSRKRFPKRVAKEVGAAMDKLTS